MEINTNIQTYTNNPTISSTSKTQTLKEFEFNLDQNMYINTDFLDEITKKISTLSYEDAKQYKPQIDEFFKQSGITDETPLSKTVPMSFPWITTINLSNDESFNKALFDKVKMEDPHTSDGWFFMLETIHNMEYAVGKKEYPFGIITIEEAYGNSPYLSKGEAKQTDAKNFFDKVISAYKDLLAHFGMDNIYEQTIKALKNVEDLELQYQKNLNDNKALLEQLTRSTKPNPLEQLLR